MERVEVKNVSLPESVKRSMSRQAETERERHARTPPTASNQASKKLAQAAAVMAADRDALQLRPLQTVLEAAAENNSAQVMPVRVELLRFFDRVGPATGPAKRAWPPPRPAAPMAVAAEHGRPSPA